MAENTSAPAANATGQTPRPPQEWISRIVIALCGGLLFFLLWMAYRGLPVDDKGSTFPAVKELLSLLLPIIGTWMGTVLAFYFSKDNFEAANKSIQKMAQTVVGTEQKLQELKVADVMIKPAMSQMLMMDDMEAFRNYKLSDLMKYMSDSHSERLPVLQKNTMKFLFLIYRSTIDRFLSDYESNRVKLKDGTTPGKADLMVKNMFESDFSIFKEIDCNTHNIFISSTATLAEARQKMLDNSICQDVFITKTGNKDEPVEGWVTNSIVIEKSELFKKAGR